MHLRLSAISDGSSGVSLSVLRPKQTFLRILSNCLVALNFLHTQRPSGTTRKRQIIRKSHAAVFLEDLRGLKKRKKRRNCPNFRA